MATLAVTAPLPVPEAGLRDNHGGTVAGAPAQGSATGVADGQGLGSGIAASVLGRKGQTGRAHPMAGLTETTGTEGGEINCANPDISAANLFIDRPPAPPLSEVDELPAPAAASGMVPVVAVPAVLDPVAVADDGATLMVARGTVAPTLLLSDDGSLD